MLIKMNKINKLVINTLIIMQEILISKNCIKKMKFKKRIKITNKQENKKNRKNKLIFRERVKINKQKIKISIKLV